MATPTIPCPRSMWGELAPPTAPQRRLCHGQAEELAADAGVVPDPAAEGRGDGAHAGGLDPADGQAQVLGVDHHPDPARVEALLERGEQLGEGGRDPAGGVGQALVGRVGPERVEERPHGVLGRLRVDPSEGTGDPEAAVGDAGHERCREVAANARTTPSLGKVVEVNGGGERSSAKAAATRRGCRPGPRRRGRRRSPPAAPGRRGWSPALPQAGRSRDEAGVGERLGQPGQGQGAEGEPEVAQGDIEVVAEDE